MNLLPARRRRSYADHWLREEVSEEFEAHLDRCPCPYEQHGVLNALPVLSQ